VSTSPQASVFSSVKWWDRGLLCGVSEVILISICSLLAGLEHLQALLITAACPVVPAGMSFPSFTSSVLSGGLW
jgi:hypothetical protein